MGIEKIFERTYMHAISREDDPPREKHPSIERKDEPQKDPYGKNKILLERKWISREEAEKILPTKEMMEKNETCTPKAIKSKPKKNHPKSNKAAIKKI